MAPPLETLEPKYHDIYDGIDPKSFIGTNKGKVVFITGASKGLGLASANAFAQTGANLFISARSTAALQQAKEDLESKYGITVGYATLDVSNEESVKAAVEAAVAQFGRIDTVISNAGGGESEGRLADNSVRAWWGTLEVNIKGSFMVSKYTIPELEKTQGRIVFLASTLGQARLPGGSAYNMSKHLLNRLAEWVTIDHGLKGVKGFAMHPGAVPTELSAVLLERNPHLRAIFIDTPQLTAWTQVRLTSGSEDWLAGRYYDSTWGFDTVGALKDKIIEEDALKNRLALPSL